MQAKRHILKDISTDLGVLKDFGIDLEICNLRVALGQEIDAIVMVMHIPVLGIPPGKSMVTKWFSGLIAIGITGLYRRKIFETWHKTLVIV